MKPTSAPQQYGDLHVSYPYSTFLGQIKSDYYNTYFGNDFYDPGQRCFCKDGCPANTPSCGKCASEQFCGSCDLQYSAYCGSYPYYGGLGWIN